MNILPPHNRNNVCPSRVGSAIRARGKTANVKKAPALVMPKATVTNVTVASSPIDFTSHTPEALDEAIVDAYTAAGRHWMASRAEVIRRILPGLAEMGRRLKDLAEGPQIAELLCLPKLAEYCRPRRLHTGRDGRTGNCLAASAIQVAAQTARTTSEPNEKR